MTNANTSPKPDDLRGLDWRQLHSDAAAGSCEDLHRALMQWLRSDELGNSRLTFFAANA
jgi:hypothetical protein